NPASRSCMPYRESQRVLHLGAHSARRHSEEIGKRIQGKLEPGHARELAATRLPDPLMHPSRKSSTCRSATAPPVLTPRMTIVPNCLRRLHVLETFDRPLVANVARVERGGRLEEQQVHLPLGNRLVLHTPRYDEKLAFVDANIAVAQAHEQLALDHEEQLIFVFMVMPHEFALELHQLHLLPIELADDAGDPVLGDEPEFFLEIDLVHHTPPFTPAFATELLNDTVPARRSGCRCSRFIDSA